MSGDNPPHRPFPWRAFIGTLIGVALLVFIFASHDFSAVLEAESLAGSGFLILVLWRAVPLLASTVGWRLLMPPAERPGLPRLWLVRWIGEAVNLMLPVAQIGGDVVRTRLAHQIPLPDGGGTIERSHQAAMKARQIGMGTAMLNETQRARAERGGVAAEPYIVRERINAVPITHKVECEIELIGNRNCRFGEPFPAFHMATGELIALERHRHVHL